MALVKKSNVCAVGYAPIDRDHAEFISLLNQLNAANNVDFPSLFQQLYEHTEQHFELENQLMKEFAFPAETEHKDEHQRLLREFKQFKARVDKGVLVFGRAFVRERLPQWFELHAGTMDRVLATYIKQ